MKLRDCYSEEFIRSFLTNITKKVNVEGDCWIWKGSLPNGVPSIQVRVGRERAYTRVRQFYYSYCNPDVAYNTPVTTQCGNPLCVNPRHLVQGDGVGTHKTRTQVLQMRKLRDNLGKMRKYQLAELLGVTTTTLAKYTKQYKTDPDYWDNLIKEL